MTMTVCVKKGLRRKTSLRHSPHSYIIRDRPAILLKPEP